MRSNANSVWIIALLVFFVGLLGTRWWLQRTYGGRLYQIIQIGDTELEVVVSASSDQIQQGLSGRQSIGADGMLFVFDTPRQPVFWMYRMLFPLDFVWIDRTLEPAQVVSIHTNVQPSDPLQPDGISRVVPNQSVTDVVELPAGWVEAHGVAVGDTVIFTDRQRTAMW